MNLHGLFRARAGYFVVDPGNHPLLSLLASAAIGQAPPENLEEISLEVAAMAGLG